MRSMLKFSVLAGSALLAGVAAMPATAQQQAVIAPNAAPQASASGYMKFDGVDGESRDGRAGKYYEVDSWSWGETNSGASPRSAVLTGNFGGCAKGAKFSNITLKRGMIDYHIDHATVTGCSTTASSSGPPMETITIVYEKIDHTSQTSGDRWSLATTQKPSANAGGEHEFEYDIRVGAFYEPPPGQRLAARNGYSVQGRSDGIQIESFSWGATQGTSASGRRMHKPVTLTKPIDRTGPGALKLKGTFGGCSEGRKFANLTLKRGIVRYELSGVEVVNCGQQSAAMPVEEVTLNYSKIEIH